MNQMRPPTVDRIAGAGLIAAALIAVFAMSHHPSGVESAGLAQPVHVVLIVALAVTAFGFAYFARARGWSRPLILAGIVSYAISVFADIGAAMISGFIAPAVAVHGADVGPDIFWLMWETNQALAALGVCATGAAFVLWSFDLIQSSHLNMRLTGVLGLLTGGGSVALLAFGWVSMDVVGASIVYGAQLAWSALVGVQLWLGNLRD